MENLNLYDTPFAAVICKGIGHKWDEFHMHEVVCSRCRTCREYTLEDVIGGQWPY
jgi:hypothetical protein